MSSSPLTLIAFEENVNLRNVTWNQRFLDKVAQKYQLQHGQAVVYTNVAKSKVRLVAVFYNMAVLILPPIDPESKISLYLKINQFLKNFSGGSRLYAFLEEEILYAQERLDRQEVRRRLASYAEKKRKKK
jgi:hypothetical protein